MIEVSLEEAKKTLSGAAPPGGDGKTLISPQQNTIRSTTFELTEWNPWRSTGAPKFPVEILPDLIRNYVVERGAMTGSDVSAWAMSALLGVSAALDHRVTLRPKQHDQFYQIHPVLWCLLCGDPSTRKSAPIGDVEAMLMRLDRLDAKTRADRVSMLVADGKDKAEAEAELPPSRRRVIADVTTEKLCDILSHQDCGIGLFRDELSGWIGAMEKYGGRGVGAAQDRSVWLKAFASQPYMQDRKSETRNISMMSASILGAIQPARLQEMPQLESDGLLQRFLPVMMSPAGIERDDPIDPAARDRFGDVLAQLGRMAIPTTFCLSTDASRAYLDFARKMTEVSTLSDPSPDFGTFLGKQARTLGALSLLFHAVDVTEGKCRSYDDVQAETVEKAREIIEGFIIPHAWHFYAMMNRKALQDVQAIAGALVKLAGQGVKRISPTNLHHACRAVRGMSLQEVQRVLVPFDVNGWVVPEDWSPTNRHWSINPQLAGRFASELAEQARRAQWVIERITRNAR